MRFTITGRQVKLSPAVVTYAKDKIAKTLGKLFRGHPELSEPAIIDAEFTYLTRHHRKGKVWQADLVMTLPREKEPIYAVAIDEDIHAAIDILAEEVEREIQKYKGRFQAQARRGARLVKRELRFDPAARLPKRGRVRNEGN